MKKAIYLFLAVLLTAIFYITVAKADWQGPTGDPPANNRLRPVDISDLAQTKIGSLTVKNGLNVGTTSQLQVGSDGTLSLQGTININNSLAIGALAAVNTAGHGIVGETSNNGSVGVYGIASAPGPAWAGYFAGLLGVTGNAAGNAVLTSTLGTAVAPAYSFIIDPNTGIYSSAADTLNFSTGGTSRVQINSSGRLGIVTLGTAVLPAYTFTGDTNTGIWSSGADTLNFSTVGIERVKIDSAGLTTLNGQIKITGGTPGLNKVLTSDATGLASWQVPAGGAGDNLGSHIATQNIQLGNFWLSGDGGNEGISVDAAGNVGIGTIAPQAKLHVEGKEIIRDTATNNPILEFLTAARIQPFTYGGASPELTGKFVGDSPNGAGLAIGGFSTGPALPAFRMQGHIGSTAPTVPPLIFEAFKFDGANYRDPVGPTEGAFAFYNGGYTDADKIILMTMLGSGNVGLGTNAPNQLLHVYRDTGNNAEIDLQSVAGANQHWAIYHDRATEDLRIWHNDITSEKNALTIENTTGNIGIGITNPPVKLTVDKGNIFVKGPNSFASDGDNATICYGDYDHCIQSIKGTGFNIGVLAGENVGIGIANPPVKLTVDSGNIFVKGPNNFASDGDSAAICYGDYNHCLKSIRGTGLELRVPGGGGSMAALSISDNTGDLQAAGYIQGNFVDKDGYPCEDGQILEYDEAEGGWVCATDDTGGGAGDNLGNHIATQNIQLGNYWLSGDGNNEGVFVDTDGEVGIGTNDPTVKLNVKGTSPTNAIILLQPSEWNSVGDYGEIRFGDQYHYIRGEWGVGTTFWENNDFIFKTNTVDPLLVMKNGGNVGIGDTSPDNLLEILSSGAANTQLSVTNTNGGDFDAQIGFQLADGANTFTVGVDDSDSDKFKISTTALGTNDRLTIDSNGVVNISNLTASRLVATDASKNLVSGGLNSAQLAASITNETGSGLAVFGTSPTFTTGITVNGMSTFGSASLVLAAAQNLIYGNIDSTSQGNLLLLQNESLDILKVDNAGNVVVKGEIKTINDSGENRLWGQGRPGVAVRDPGGECTVGNTKISRGNIMVEWGNAAAGCPVGTWACTFTERGMDVCNTAGILTCSDTSAAGESHACNYAWLADRYPMDSGRYGGSRTNGDGNLQSRQSNESVPVWCCWK